MDSIADGDAAAALTRLDHLYAGGKEMSALIGELAALTRDLLVRKTASQGGGGLMTGGFDETTLKRLSSRFPGAPGWYRCSPAYSRPVRIWPARPAAALTRSCA